MLPKQCESVGNEAFWITNINERLVANIGDIVFLARYYFTEIFYKVKAKCAGKELTEKQNMRGHFE